MLHRDDNKQAAATSKNMDESHKHNIEGKRHATFIQSLKPGKIKQFCLDTHM